MIRIRTAESEADFALCADIWLAASHDAHSFVETAYWQEHHGAMRERYLPASRVRIAEADGHAVGFSAMRSDRLEALFVSPVFWSKGIGGALLREILAASGQVSLSVYVKNEKAVNFYINHGFQITGRTVCPHTGEQELTMFWTRNGK